MINTVNLMAKPNPAQPFDLQSQQAALAQQAAIAQALIAKSLEEHSPIIRTGGSNPFARDVVNFGDPIASVAQAMIGRKQSDEAQAGQAALNAELQRRSQAEMTDIQGARTGAVQPPAIAADEQGNPYPPVQTPGNYNLAIQKAMQATTPAGKAMLADLLKGQMSPDEALKQVAHATPASLQNAVTSQNLADVKPAVKVLEYKGAATPYSGAEPVGPTRPLNTFTNPEVDPTTNILGTKSNVTNEFQGIASNTPPMKYQEQYSAARLKLAEEGRKTYQENITALQNFAQIQEQLKVLPGEKFGTAAEIRQFGNKLAEMVGAKQMPDTSNMEVLHAALGDLVINNAHKLAPTTDKDVDRIKGYKGSEGFTKRGLEQAIDVMQQAAVRGIETHRKTMETMALPPGVTREEHMQFFAPDYSVQPIPAPGKPQPAVTPSGAKVYYYKDGKLTDGL